MEKLAQSLGIANISRSQVSEITKGLKEQVSEFRNRSLAEHRYPVIWVDALYEKVRFDGHVISMAVMVVSGVNEEGSREILAIEPFVLLSLSRELDQRKISITNILERLNKEIRRRSRGVGIFSNPESYIRLITMYMIEYTEDWSTSQVYLSRQSIQSILAKAA